MTTEPTRVHPADDAVSAALRTVVSDFGDDVMRSPDRVRGALSDALGTESREHRAAIDALALAVEEGIATDVQGPPGRDVGDLADRLIARGLTAPMAQWAVAAWQRAMSAEAPPERTVRRSDLFATVARTQPGSGGGERAQQGEVRAESSVAAADPAPPAVPTGSRLVLGRKHLLPVLVIVLMLVLGLLMLGSAADAATQMLVPVSGRVP